MTYEQHARVATDEPARFMKQLCRHFGHKLAVEFDDKHGSIVFAAGRCDLSAEAEALELVASSDSEEGAARVAEVIGSHLTRFGFKSGLTVAFEPNLARVVEHEEPETPSDSPLRMADVMSSPFYLDLMSPELAAGELAAPFELPTLGGETVRLADFAGVSPVALAFGSYT